MLTPLETLQLVLLVGVAIVAAGCVGIRISSAQRAKAQRGLVNRGYYPAGTFKEYLRSVESEAGDPR